MYGTKIFLDTICKVHVNNSGIKSRNVTKNDEKREAMIFKGYALVLLSV